MANTSKIHDRALESIPGVPAPTVSTRPSEDPPADYPEHGFDETSVLNPVTGKPYGPGPLWAGSEPMDYPDPLCICGAFWDESEGGCQALAQHVVEHAIEMSGGGMHVHYDHPDIERIFPLADWIKSQQRFGGKVWRRTVIVVDDWQEVPTAAMDDEPTEEERS